MTRLQQRLRLILTAPATYPVTAVYVAAVVVLMAVSTGHLRLAYGIAVLAFFTLVVILLSVERELKTVEGQLKTVHVLVDGHHAALVRRIDSLVAALLNAGVAVPDDPEAPKTARAEDNIA